MKSRIGLFCCCCLMACAPSRESEKIIEEIECLKQELDSLVRLSDKQSTRFSKPHLMMIPGKGRHPWETGRGTQQEPLVIEQVETP